MTGWIISPCSGPSCRTPNFQFLPLAAGHTPEWCEGDALTWPGGSWTPSIGQGRRQRIFLVADLGGRRAGEILFKPRPMLLLSGAGPAGGLSAAAGDRGPFLEAGGRVPIVRPFQPFRMRSAAKRGKRVQFRNSFGRPDDPFSTLLAGRLSPFAFWFEDDPLGGCVRYPTELECERMLGLPEGWTKYGADGEEIRPAQRYRALGNAVALPCADYIMAGIAEVLADPGG